MAEQLRGVASGIYYPYPNKLAAGVLSTQEPEGWLLITFTREQLARAAELLRAPATRTVRKISRQDVSAALAARPIRE
jgi:hypothetical protein